MKGAWVLAGGVIAANVVVLAALAVNESGPGQADRVVVEDVVAQDPAAPVVPLPTTPPASTGQTAPDGPIGPAELADSRPPPLRASPEWVAKVSAETGIGSVAVRAYGTATLTLARDVPGCRLGWPTLAGIGAIESGHGTHAGAVLLDDGHPSLPVLGPALDGTNGTAAIHARPDDTAWTQDPDWAHAVGPMQFLPSTWRRWASDGDGDGVQDPNDLDDAAVAAGRYLCAAGGDLSTGAGWWAAVRSYNHDDAYVAQVLATADGYAART
ncbi:lytic transglycosylase domain-containing protein [Cellulomonas sp. URHE0023]|uniref:lytic transglycosylase domain-containing protein n=1 Tax=Cellulomonas sp. URHE0023 TaxID=1380354 RepID=UPI00068F0098|nr:lytic transglycosylase domain-containing protein [Cellulomonas sp. URHE0023]